ncbi:hypothetical protein BH23GEM6_BH23GEM6_01770 [soil metagenome]
MKRRAIYLALSLAIGVTACDRGTGEDGFQDVRMDQEGIPGGPAGSAIPPRQDRYQDASTGTVGTDASPAVVTGDGREGPDTVYSPVQGRRPGDTIR